MSQTERKLIPASEIREVAQAIWARRQEEYLLEQAERIELANAQARLVRLDYLLQWCEREGVEYLPNSEGYLPIPGGWLIEASFRYGELLAQLMTFSNRGWWFVHNVLAHPLLSLCPGPTKWALRFHDWTSRKAGE